MKRAIVVAIIASMVAGALGGCASILKGTSQEVFLVSEPSKAEIYINGQLRGNTPLELKLETDKTYVIEYRMDTRPRPSTSRTASVLVGSSWMSCAA